MQRRFITRVDIMRLPEGSTIALRPEDRVTVSAWDAARMRGVRIEGVQPPAPRNEALEETAPGNAVSRPRAGARTGDVIVSAFGINRRGVLAEITAEVSRLGGNVQDINQKIVGEYFHLIMIVNIAESAGDFSAFKAGVESLAREGGEGGLFITVQHERVFRAMHRV